jgi:Methyltransferase domain
MDTPAPVLQLEDDQLVEFDTEYVTGALWDHVQELIEAQFPDGEFNVLDIGGGNGRFSDALLDHYPRATVVLFDNAQVLLDRNEAHPRKELVNASVTDLTSVVGDRRFDLVCLHWVLHHFVVESYTSTRRFQQEVLRQMRTCLSARGRVSVFEDLYDGAVVDRLPGRLIYTLTSLRRLAPLIHRLGANTAGCGVCFLSERDWLETFAKARLSVEESRRFPDSLDVNLITRIALQAASAEMGHFWLRPSNGAP